MIIQCAICDKCGAYISSPPTPACTSDRSVQVKWEMDWRRKYKEFLGLPCTEHEMYPHIPFPMLNTAKHVASGDWPPPEKKEGPT